ncbi:MAG: hypothetical protein AB1716_10720, partial [Planctomycetota bacterium]
MKLRRVLKWGAATAALFFFALWVVSYAIAFAGLRLADDSTPYRVKAVGYSVHQGVFLGPTLFVSIGNPSWADDWNAHQLRAGQPYYVRAKWHPVAPRLRDLRWLIDLVPPRLVQIPLCAPFLLTAIPALAAIRRRGASSSHGGSKALNILTVAVAAGAGGLISTTACDLSGQTARLAEWVSLAYPTVFVMLGTLGAGCGGLRAAWWIRRTARPRPNH